ncbi:MAG TPA: hypothetical protein VNG51_08585 [Ktedonobacteraceae bacterium]|nr:hypothetical protein [Ktedonobacteraceae bacterium]
MLLGLYRVYLYIVYIAMLIFAAVGLGMFLQTILAQTIFRDPYNVPTSANVVQSGTFAAVSWLIAGLVGGLHYWLIRRDMRNDASAKGGAVRAFFLNFTEIQALPLAVGLGASTISMLGESFSSISGTAAFTIAALALWTWLDWERRRAEPNTGAAIAFQRIHLYGVQLILLFILSASWIPTVGQLVDTIFYGGKGSGTPTCVGFIVCQQGPNLLSLAASTLFIVLFWLYYGYLSRNDTASLFRRIFHFIGYGSGLIYLLEGVYHIFTRLQLTILKVPLTAGELSGPGAQYDIVSPLSLGLITIGVYLFWLRRTEQKHPAVKALTNLSLQAITATFMAVPFWWGCGSLLLNILEKIAPSSTPLTTESWAFAIALILTGVGYIPLDILLRRRSSQTTLSLALRGFVLALLGGSILAIAIGGAVTLYAYSTSLLGSPLDNWQFTAHTGLAAFITGVIIAALYLWTGARGGIFTRRAQPTQPITETTTKTAVPVVPSLMPSISAIPTAPLAAPMPVDTHSSAIGVVLDDLVAGTISRGEAIARIKLLSEQPI